jgi:hypothetical protein
MAKRHLIGLLLATEEDWPIAFEAVTERLGSIQHAGERHAFVTERLQNEPFDPRYVPRYALVIDRLSWWYHLPREWLKKVVLMDDVHLLNNPFTFQAMEKHAAYCAMMRLGLRVPATWLIPHKLPPDNPRYVPMAERYNPSWRARGRVLPDRGVHGALRHRSAPPRRGRPRVLPEPDLLSAARSGRRR